MTDAQIEARRAELEADGISQPIYEFRPLTPVYPVTCAPRPDQTYAGWANWWRRP